MFDLVLKMPLKASIKASVGSTFLALAAICLNTSFPFTFRSSHRRCSVRKSVLRNFSKCTGKHLCRSLLHRCFSVNFAKFLRTPFSQNTSGRLLLYFVNFYFFQYSKTIFKLCSTRLILIQTNIYEKTCTSTVADS